MNYKQIATQAIEFQKTAFTNWYNAVAMIQGQSASAMEAMMNQANLPMPEAARKAVTSWVNIYQGGIKSFQFCAESGFFNFEKYLVQEATPTPEKAPKMVAEEKKAAPAKSKKPVVEEKEAAPVINIKTSPSAK